MLAVFSDDFSLGQHSSREDTISRAVCYCVCYCLSVAFVPNLLEQHPRLVHGMSHLGQRDTAWAGEKKRKRGKNGKRRQEPQEKQICGKRIRMDYRILASLHYSLNSFCSPHTADCPLHTCSCAMRRWPLGTRCLLLCSLSSLNSSSFSATSSNFLSSSWPLAFLCLFLSLAHPIQTHQHVPALWSVCSAENTSMNLLLVLFNSLVPSPCLCLASPFVL